MRDLVEKAIQGDKSAREQIFRILRVRFVLLAKRRIGEEWAEDIAHEACITVLEKLGSLNSNEKFEAFSYKVLRNKIGNYTQSAKRRPERMTDREQTGEVAAGADSNPDPTLKRRLLDCLKKIVRLNQRYGRTINLAHQGYETAEICQRLGVKQNHLYVLLNRGRKMLEDCMADGEAY